jgi:monooxygenase
MFIIGEGRPLNYGGQSPKPSGARFDSCMLAMVRQDNEVTNHVDVLVIGAGVSGVSAGYHLQDRCPGKTYAILEGRERMGGTWDLFRYPGIRSDSDMHTFGFSFRPWVDAKAIADGPSILRYLEDTAKEFGIDKHIRYQHRVVRAEWSSQTALWTVDIERGALREATRLTCGFLHMCTGYYRYGAGYTPPFEGMERFNGEIVHPQQWSEKVNYVEKRVVVIGSGATAVTLVPELAKLATHVTMLQRSPTFMLAGPAEDKFANRLRMILPSKIAYGVTRWKNVLRGMVFFNLARKRPAKVKERMISMVRDELGPDYDVATHFTPRYNPWDQRVCLVPDGDFFAAIKSGKASVVTDHVASFTEDGIRLQSGTELKADLVVTATGLQLQLLGAMELMVDDKKVDLSKCLQYKGMMFSDIPNLASTFGYTNASWTLKADLTSAYLCRLLNHMEKSSKRICVARNSLGTVATEPFVDFSSGYFQRVLDELPKQGPKKPWRLNQSYLLDVLSLRLGSVEDNAMTFVNPSPSTVPTSVLDPVAKSEPLEVSI